MRVISSETQALLNKSIQTRNNKSDINSVIWVSRPSTVLLDERFIERQTVLDETTITDVSIAVCHPRAKKSNTEIYIGYISNGQAKVVHSKHKTKMDTHNWFDSGFVADATAISVAFDGTMPRSRGNEVEFVTETVPWIFWVDNEKLYANKLDSTDEPYVLAENNCTDVSAIRAMWSGVGTFDFGLVSFFIVNGQLYYRQLINGEWMDAEMISYGPSGATWVEVSAFRTWDYRVGIQAKTADGVIYELYTQFMGVGKQLTEHISASVEPHGENIAIQYRNTKDDEHIEADVRPIGTRLYALTSIPVSAINIDDGTGNYGLRINVVMDYPVTNVYGQESNFVLRDGRGNVYGCTESYISNDGLTLLLAFNDFNLAEGTTLAVEYTQGGMMSPVVPVESFSITFTPEGLVAPDIDPPEFVSIWNMDQNGTKIAIRFTESIIGDINDNEDKFTITMDDYDMVPEGAMYEATRPVVELRRYSSVENMIDLESGSKNGIECDNGVLSLEVIEDE